MPRGRPRKPTDQHVLDGTFRTDRHADVGAAAEGKPEMPSRFKGEAAAFWKLVVPGMIEAGRVGLSDTPALSALCEWWARYRKWSAALDAPKADPDTIDQKARLVESAWKNFDRLAARFGLNPIDRQKLPKGKPAAGGIRTRKRAG